MPSDDLRKLWKLHLVDLGLHEIRKRAAALDPGRKLQGELAVLTADFDTKNAALKSLTGEQTDTELQQKSMDDKLKKVDKELYGGKIVNPREVANLQKEVATIKNHRGDLDVRLLELWEEIPPARAMADEAGEKVAVKRRELDEYQKTVLKLKAELEAEFKQRAAQRPLAAQEVPPALLARYEAIRKKYDGIGMARISKTGSCEACGMRLPTKVVEDVRDGRVVTCEACHRILYGSEGLI